MYIHFLFYFLITDINPAIEWTSSQLGVKLLTLVIGVQSTRS